MFSTKYHGESLDNTSILVTGGAGFIGSNIVEYLVYHGAKQIRILDNLSEGKLENIRPFLDRPSVDFLEGDIVDEATCRQACQGVDVVCHQAALGSVPRSIQTPLLTNGANVTGFLNMLTATKDAGIKRFVYASSSSIYGDSPTLPKTEAVTGAPLSPYAVTKCVNELYAAVYAKTFGLETVGLRYFNVFGPRQKPDGPYAAVIPLFIDALINNKPPVINGDGTQSRDFTFVLSAVQANIRGLFGKTPASADSVFNVAHGEQTSLNELFAILKELIGSELNATHSEPRQGDVKHSLADISSARRLLNYAPTISFRDGLQKTLDWFHI